MNNDRYNECSLSHAFVNSNISQDYRKVIHLSKPLSLLIILRIYNIVNETHSSFMNNFICVMISFKKFEYLK